RTTCSGDRMKCTSTQIPTNPRASTSRSSSPRRTLARCSSTCSTSPKTSEGGWRRSCVRRCATALCESVRASTCSSPIRGCSRLRPTSKTRRVRDGVSARRIVKIGIVQSSPTPDPKENLVAALDATAEAVARGADIICLPELFLTPYFCQTEDPEVFKLAEAVPGPTTDRFLGLAAEHDIAIILSLFEKRAAGLYHNSAVMIDGKRGYVGRYRKMHIPDDPRYYEKYAFTPGDLGFKTFDTPKAEAGVLICWDQWYPEAARLTAMRGAEILFYPTAIGWHPDERESHGAAQHGAWEVAQRAHAVANGCFVVAVNRVGFEPTPDVEPAPGNGIQFWGQSFVVGPDGQIVHRGSATEPEVAVVEIDLAQIGEIRHGWPFFRDRDRKSTRLNSSHVKIS